MSYCYDNLPGSGGACQTTLLTGYIGRLTYVANANSSTLFGAFDAMGRVSNSTQTTNGTAYPPFSYIYDKSGALASETYPSGSSLTDTFDAAGRVIKIQGTLGGAKTYASNILYAPQGAVQSLPLGNGVTETWTFSTLRQQPTSLTAGSALALGFYYCPNQQPSCTTNNGNILGATIASSGGVNASQAFGYDRVNRLTASN